MQQYANSPAAQRAIVETAERDGPAMMRAIGIFVDDAAQISYPIARPPEQSPNGHGPAGNGNGRH